MSAPGTQYALFELAEVIPVEMQPAESASQRFSDYVVYVDESGDHSLASIDSDYPVFVLALCVFHKRHYSEKIIPAVEKLKFNYFGHDSVVLHENEIRKSAPAVQHRICRQEDQPDRPATGRLGCPSCGAELHPPGSGQSSV